LVHVKWKLTSAAEAVDGFKQFIASQPKKETSTPAIAATSTFDLAKPSAANPPASRPQDDWQPVNDRVSNDGFAIRDERAPIFKWVISLLALAIVGGGAIWLASKVVIADDVPTIERAEKPPKKDAPQAPKSEDDLAWVKALEIDTVEGYRAYIADFPNGRHVEDAQRLIDEFDEEAWKLADERDTIAGYEDYLESWPEGLHATEAKERIAQKKAEEEARRKNAEEAARQEAAPRRKPELIACARKKRRVRPPRLMRLRGTRPSPRIRAMLISNI